MNLIASLLISCVALQGVPPLLPSIPEGWQRERLDFPLSFAPEIEHEGFEDLAFAPGMFAKGSDSYFSYVLALRLEGDVPVDAEMLRQFLEKYYRGLCGAVGNDRGLQRDPSKVRATVQPEGAGFTATVEMYDPFTDGGDVRLDFEIAQHSAPRATELIGLASPLPRDASIWKELRAIGDAWRAARPPAVFLNHLYAVVDRETYDAIARSTFLRETFAVSEERTTVRTDMTYSGLYFYGRRTYFEFLPPTPAPELPIGGTGLAFGVETKDGNEAFARRLAEHRVGTMTSPVTRRLGEKATPWFEILGIESASARLNLSVLEYDPRFLSAWHADLAPKGGGISRAAVLERYAAALDRSSLRETAPFADVISVELALADADRERMLEVCKAAGYEITADGDNWSFRGPQCGIVITSAKESRGIVAFEVALSRRVEHEPIELGRARLRFEGDRATFTLE